MAASSPLTAAVPHFCCPRRYAATPSWSYNLKETRKYRSSSKKYFQRAAHKASLAIIYRTTQFRCKAATMEVALANECLLTGEEAVITAAAAEAVALARAALEVAKEAVQLSETTDFSIKSSPQTLALESMQSLGSQALQNHVDESMIQIEEKLTGLEDNMEVTVRSRRQGERRARRQIVAEKTERLSVPNKKRDLLKISKRRGGSYKPLTMAEERELSEGVQDLLRLQAIEKTLSEQNGQDPSFATWAAAVHVDQRTLRRRLEHGMRCKDKMLRCNIRLVVSIAKNYAGVNVSFEDLVQEGYRGLVKGVEKFDGSKGFKFSTYAYWWIKQAIRKALSRSSRLIQLPFNVVNASYQVKDAINELKQGGKTMKDLATQEIANTAGVTTNMVKKVMLLPKNPRSLESTMIGIDKNTKLADCVPCREQDSLQYIVNREFTRSGINMVLDTLTAREKTVIRGRYGLDDGRAKTLQEIGDQMGISRERVRQIELCAFRKLKSKKRMNIIQDYAKAYRS